MKNINAIEEECFNLLSALNATDAAHDLNHTLRVVNNCKLLMKIETVDSNIVIISAWLHDVVTLPKNHPNKTNSSQLSADYAVPYLKKWGCSPHEIKEIKHCIIAHSFSANIHPETIEAKLLQDADRLDSLGAIGVSRCLQIGGAINIPLYNRNDPFCTNREPEDKNNSIDHFYKKLFLLPCTLHTSEARKMAEQRVVFMRKFLEELNQEIDHQNF